ncbi:SDR family oxidoreductase [Maridesulfovibrio ferrireducens]|uniref:SDR family oxidoreductase n=1 Tax=Maridesulfovibrio ferrireducens TaxID=246191 RepID=UPI001A2DB8F4|nr:SDR family oxidoreductase [Maridesulfovibrio ferrireducens]MBI9111918.1 SDR family oxidoreductase [Maridesulfovibrio ferrireducens]
MSESKSERIVTEFPENISEEDRHRYTICVLGATGYVGGRLVPQLLENGWRVRAVGRSLSKLKCRPFAMHERCEVVAADLFDYASLLMALNGCYAAYYLVHSMQSGSGDFAAKDRTAAQNTVRAAQGTGLARIIYLGGLIPDDPNISHHLKSRAEVGEILSGGTVPCTTFRAGVIIGSGSASFEMIRYLVDRLPVMITPKWVQTETQPISIRDVVFYLSGCLEHSETAGDAFDIGGPYIETYERLFRVYQEEAGLHRRLIIPVPFLTPKLSSYWLGFVSPIPVALARPLVMGLRNRVVCKDYRIREIMPHKLSSCRLAISRALDKVAQQLVDSCWSDAGSINMPEWAICGDAGYTGGTVFHTGYRIKLQVCSEKLWSNILAIGGDNGWYGWDALWSVRGWLDKFIGGVGLRRGRRHPTLIAVGDALDFWRVLDVQAGKRLLLIAEMKLPGEALLEFTLEEEKTGDTVLTMTARFLPRGVAGLLYWWSVYPFHSVVFKGMAKALAEKTACKILEGPTLVKGAAPKCHLPKA